MRWALLAALITMPLPAAAAARLETATAWTPPCPRGWTETLWRVAGVERGATRRDPGECFRVNAVAARYGLFARCCDEVGTLDDGTPVARCWDPVGPAQAGPVVACGEGTP